MGKDSLAWIGGASSELCRRHYHVAVLVREGGAGFPVNESADLLHRVEVGHGAPPVPRSRRPARPRALLLGISPSAVPLVEGVAGRSLLSAHTVREVVTSGYGPTIADLATLADAVIKRDKILKGQAVVDIRLDIVKVTILHAAAGAGPKGSGGTVTPRKHIAASLGDVERPT